MGASRVCLLVVGVLSTVPASQAGANETAVVPVNAERGALSFLKSLPREWAGTSAKDCKTYEHKNIERLSASFAASAASFLRAFVEIHGTVTITSAHRTAREQECVCVGEKGPCAGRPRTVKNKKGRFVVRRNGTSRHQHGIALDVRAGTGSNEEFSCLHEFALLNPRFGVRFPLGLRDRPHMEPAPGAGAKVKLAALGSMLSSVAPCTNMRAMLTQDHVD